MFNEEEKREFREMAGSKRIRQDFRIMTQNRRNPFLVNGVVNLDRFADFLNDYNEFVGHLSRPLRKISGKDMRL